jgi:pimeloyl-ACP methyl ester carboxylesterase
MGRQIYNKHIQVSGINIFYREAGDIGNPSILLLHGFPTSSVMFKNLMTLLSDRFHLVAPDYPGFGFSDFPPSSRFEYTFSNISSYISKFTDAIGLSSFSMYLHDYGCPIGLRMCVHQPEKIEKLVIQNGNAYDEGIGPQWNETLDYWQHPTPEKKKSEQGVKMEYAAGLPDDMLNRISPELPMLDWELMKRPGNIDMQFELNRDYENNIKMFPVFQQYFRTHQPPALIIWGAREEYFSVAEAPCYKKDLPDAQVHILDGGHMLLETHLDEVHRLVSDFMR